MAYNYQQYGNPTISQQSQDQLSFITSQEQQKYKELFHKSTNSISISPDIARSILLKSNLNPHQLAKIWDLSDLNKSGDLLFPEFALSLYLCNLVLKGYDLPYQLDSQIKKEVESAVDKINFSIPESIQISSNGPENNINNNNIVPSNNLNNDQFNGIFNQPQIQPSTDLPSTQPLNQQITGYSSLQPQISTNSNNQFQPNQQNLQQQPTGYPLQTQSTGFKIQQDHQQQQQQNSTGYSSQPIPQQTTGYPSQQQQSNTNSQSSVVQLQPQTTNYQSQTLGQQQTGFLNTQTTGFSSQPQFFKSPTKEESSNDKLVPQFTGFQQSTIQPQLTGYQQHHQHQQQQQQVLQPQLTSSNPLKPQLTSGAPLKSQLTSGAAVQSQLTAGAPLQAQITNGVSLQPQFTAALKPQLTSGAPLQSQATGLVPLDSVTSGTIGPIKAQPTGTLIPLQQSQFEIKPLTQQKTGVGQNNFFINSLLQQSQAHVTNVGIFENEQISSEEKRLFNKIFDNYDTSKKGLLDAEISAEIFRKSGLNREELENIWDLITRANQTHLDKESFQLGMWLVYKRLNGFQLPEVLPESLKPSSLKILDNVKNQLKFNSYVKTIKKSSNSKLDGSRFKNNDDDIIQSTSRHRRRRQPIREIDAESSKELSIEELKRKIWEKKILLEDLQLKSQTQKSDDENYEQEDLNKIEQLIKTIQNLPQSKSQNNELKTHFNSLISKVPKLIDEILSFDNEIKNSKIELIQLNSSISIKGTGSNGELTDFDRRKFKSKLLLAEKMNKLTGKPIPEELKSFESNELLFNEKIDQIKQESIKNVKIINDINESINEVSKNVLSTFKSEIDSDDYKKWQLGIGVQPKVAELIKTFRVEELSSQFSNFTIIPTNSNFKTESLTSSSRSTPLSVNPTDNHSNRSKSISKYSTVEERKAYIKEQARNKMNERLAKFGINRSKPLDNFENVQPVITKEITTPIQQQSEYNESSSDDDDEEEFQRMEEIRRLKRLERDARLAELKSQEDSI
ncbi:hypothetical protein WICMUC_004932 [Wickerhamomyces mucosus]|uniref:Actin cytoskeleton-regulatory complex protein PAN1 n=1 Tax=Wickerhamomyces mucosus TaxID=1378264 RepID=A0A9P8T975_9ASCO|nr:hypothetical protein WICMUC_004932 [Wickerhamomyces mucosus]